MGNDFVYRDNFTRNKDEYGDEAGLYGEYGDRLFKNTETNGRFHSDWCSMMYPRLVLRRNLLSKEGFIFMSIGAEEVENLIKICNEVFGKHLHLGTFIWKRRQMVDSRSKNGVSEDHEYMLCYAKTSNQRIRGKETDMSKYSNPDRDPRGDWMSADMTGLATASQRPNLHYDLENPKTGIVYACPPTGWRFEKKRMEELIENDEIIFPANTEGRPRRKNFVRDLQNEYAGLSTVLDTVYNTQDTRELKLIFDGEDFFDFPKPVELLKLFVQQGSSENDIILDFFSGSATTAHAVMQLNAEDGGKRKFIMVQLPEECAEGTEAAKAGYKNICEIGKERTRRAGDKIVNSLPLTYDSKEVMQQYGCIKLLRTDCLAKSDEADGNDSFSDQEIAKIGSLRFVGSEETSGSVNSLEHCGGTRKKLKQRICSVSDDSTGVKGRIGESTIDLRQGGIFCRFGHFGSDRIDTRNRQNAECPHDKTENSPLKTDRCQLGISFRVLKLDDTNMKDVYYAASEYTQDLIIGMEDNIKDDRTDIDLLYTCLLDWGLPLFMLHTHEKIDGFTVHTYNDGDLIACFDKQISDAVVKEIDKRLPLRAVFRDSSFTSSPEKINVEEIFKLLTPNTNVRVM